MSASRVSTLVDQRIVITGVTGQVAKPLALRLAESNQVIGLARFSSEDARAELETAGVKCLPVNLRTPDLAAVPTEVDYVLNLAVAKTGRWDIDMAINSGSVGHLMAHFAGAKAFLHCSTTAVYQPAGPKPLAEDHPLGDHHAAVFPTYSITKIASEAAARFGAGYFEVPTVIARLNMPYGDDYGWPAFHIMMMKNDIPIDVHVDGAIYNPIHADDIAAHLPALLDHATVDAPVTNWAGNEAVSVAEWTTFLGERIGCAPIINKTEATFPSAHTDTKHQRTITGPCQVGWEDGFTRLATTFTG